MIAQHDYAANNTGLLLIMDVIMSTLGIVFVIWHAIARRTSPASELPAPEARELTATAGRQAF